MTHVFEKRLRYVGNDVDMCEMAKICLLWLTYFTNGLNMLEMTQRISKWLKYLGNVLDIWGTS